MRRRHARARKHTDVQPIRPELADVPAPWLVGKPAGKPVFRLRCKAVHILRADLDAARTAWLDEARNPAERTEREKSSFVLRAQKKAPVGGTGAIG